MSEANKALIRRFYQEVFDNGKLDALDQFIAADIVDHDLPPGLPAGREGVKAFLGMFLSAFPDMKMTVEDEMADGDKVVTRFTATGTHTGDLMGIPPTNKHVSVGGIDINRVTGGQIVEHWGQFDQMGMMQQLGVVPAPGEG